jgi:hypothetical protein
MKKKGCKTVLIAAKKENKLYYGTAPKIATLVKKTAMTVNRWTKEGVNRIENGYELIFNMEKL